MLDQDVRMQGPSTEEDLRAELHQERERRQRAEKQIERTRQQLKEVRQELQTLRVWYSPAWEKVRAA